MPGVIVNTLTVIIGSLIGLAFRRGIPERVSAAMMLGIGLCTVYIGISGALSGSNTLVLILSVIIGAVVGTLIGIDRGIEKLGGAVEARFAKDGGGKIAQGFVTASLVFCMGSMTVVGSLQAGTSGDCSTLYTKSVLDFISSMVFASSLGVGVLMSAVFVLVFQGGLVLLSGVIAPVLGDAVIAEMTCAGSVLIIGLGLNLLGITKLKIADYLPAILLPIGLCPLYDLCAGLLSKL